jgi:hypothetical protein
VGPVQPGGGGIFPLGLVTLLDSQGDESGVDLGVGVTCDKKSFHEGMRPLGGTLDGGAIKVLSVIDGVGVSAGKVICFAVVILFVITGPETEAGAEKKVNAPTRINARLMVRDFLIVNLIFMRLF